VELATTMSKKYNLTSIGHILEILSRSGRMLPKALIQNHCALPARRMKKNKRHNLFPSNNLKRLAATI